MPHRKRSRGRHRTRNIAIGSGLVIALVAIGAILVSLRGSQASAGPTTSGGLSGYLMITPSTPVLGSKTAPFTIFEFGDFQCPSCDYWFKTQESQVVQSLVDTGQAKLAWRDFIIYDSDSRLAASAAYAAGEQGAFWQFHDMLYSNQGQANSGWVTQQLMVSFAQKLGLNTTEFTQSMNSGKYNSLIDSNFRAGQALAVQGTPTFIVVASSGQYVVISGPQPVSVFQQAINSLGGG